MQCKKCGKPIEMIKMVSGTTMPVDAEKVYVRLDPEGPIDVVIGIGLYGHKLSAVYTNPGAPGTIKAYQTHWPNCAQGITRTAKLSQAEWRKRQEQRRPTRPTKSSTHHPHYDSHKKIEQKPKLEQIALF